MNITPQHTTPDMNNVKTQLLFPIRNNISTMFTIITSIISMCYLSITTKTKKCQPAARGAPDLIQTECTPDRGLARHKQINRTKNKKQNKSGYKLESLENVKIKTKKCQPAARGAPDLIQTECTPDRGLARHKQINRTKNRGAKTK